jgi:hypothetical protein
MCVNMSVVGASRKCDLKIKCANGVVHCHREVLHRLCSSEFIHNLMTENFSTSISRPIFLTVLRLMYYGKVHIEKKMLVEFQKAIDVCGLDQKKLVMRNTGMFLLY